MKPVTYQYSNVAKHGDDQVVTFKVFGVTCAVLCDGVSTSSCGHIAAAITCFAVREFLVKNIMEETEPRCYRKIALEAVQYAGQELAVLGQQLIRTYTPIPAPAGEVPVSNSMPDDADNAAREPAISVWQAYNKACEFFQYNGCPDNQAKVIKLLEAGQTISFECTLSLNLVYQPEKDGDWELLSVNYGDSELHVVTWDELTNKITAFLPHYKLTSDVLRSFISNAGSIVTGTPVILTRNITVGDTVLLTTDGAYLHYTTRGGFPYEPFKRKFSGAKTTAASLRELPEAWFQYLQGEQAINDDYTLVLIDIVA